MPIAAALSGVIFAGLVGAHYLWRQGGAKPAAGATQRSKHVRPAAIATASTAPAAMRTMRLRRPATADAKSIQPVPAPIARPQASEPAAHANFEHLQTLVAELARSTPGPKARTPDPDSPLAATEAPRTFSIAMEQAAAAQAAASKQATRAMAQRSFAPVGIAADLADALACERVTVYLEPIQQIEIDRPRHFEVSVRFKNAGGAELPHTELLAAAREAGLLARVDAAILPRAARIAQHFQLRGRETEILTRVHGASLPDLDFRAEVTAATIAADGAALVLSFAQGDVRAFGPIHWDILSAIADMGLRFAIESVTDLDMDFEALKRRGFDFVKLDADVLLGGLPATGALVPSRDVCRHFASLALALIVSHIDDRDALARVLGYGVVFGQGALFGSRRAVRPEMLAAAG